MQEITETEWFQKPEAEQKAWQEVWQNWLTVDHDDRMGWVDAHVTSYNIPFEKYKSQQAIRGIKVQRIYRKASPIQGEEEAMAATKEEMIEFAIKHNIITTGYTGKRLEFLKWALRVGFEFGMNWQKHQLLSGDKNKQISEIKRRYKTGQCGFIMALEEAYDYGASQSAALLSAKDKEIDALKQQLNSKS